MKANLKNFNLGTQVRAAQAVLGLAEARSLCTLVGATHCTFLSCASGLWMGAALLEWDFGLHGWTQWL